MFNKFKGRILIVNDIVCKFKIIMGNDIVVDLCKINVVLGLEFVEFDFLKIVKYLLN